MKTKLKFKCKSVKKERVGSHSITLVNNEFTKKVAGGTLTFYVHEGHEALKFFKKGNNYTIDITK